MATNVFLSCSSRGTEAQERLVEAVQRHFEAQGLRPLTVGRTVDDAGSPLRLVDKVMRRCAGAAILAYERVHIAEGKDRRGAPGEVPLAGVNTATPWNQIEAAFAYALRLPLLVIVENSVRQEGLLEHGADWRVVRVGLDEPLAANPHYDAVFRAWRKQVSRVAWRKGFATQLQVGERIQNQPIAVRRSPQGA